MDFALSGIFTSTEDMLLLRNLIENAGPSGLELFRAVSSMGRSGRTEEMA